MIARIRLFFRQRRCRKLGHAWKCLHCYEPEVVSEINGFNLSTGQASVMRIVEQKHKVTCTRCGGMELKVKRAMEIAEKF